jgi:membrane protein implicated in regulation of membrane protease activity
MLHLVLGIIAIGLVLYFWERFPSFKWVFATIVAIPILLVVALLFADHNKKIKREKEEAEFNQRYEIEQKAAEVQKQLQSYEDLKRIKDSIDQRLKEDKYENDEEKQKDIISSKQLELWVSEAKKKVK